MKPREYQVEALTEVLGAWSSGMQRPAVVLPTGSGKTVVFAHLCALLARRGERPLILVNRDELVRQTVNKLRVIAPLLTFGVIQANRDESHGAITVASIQTLSRMSRLSKFDPNRFNRIIADECHYSAADGWRRVLEYFGAFDKESDTKIVGFTATMVRTDRRGLGEIWDDVVFTRDLRWAIENEFLVPVEAQTLRIDTLDLGKVKVRNGDLSDGDLGRAMAQAGAGHLIAEAYLQHARTDDGELRRGICFAPTIETAESFLEDFRHAGIPTELVIGTTPPTERQAKYAATTAGTNRVLMSVGVLTTGFDLPSVEVAVIARPTKSAGLYQQMCGRVLRLSPSTGKKRALILDIVGATRLGLASVVDLQLDKPIQEPDELEEPGSPRQTQPRPAVPDELQLVATDPFTGRRIDKKAKRSAWLLSKAGRPFLPSTSTWELVIFLWRDPDGTWAVGEKPKSGKARRLEVGLTFEQARAEALDSYPYPSGAPKLSGLATPAQTAALWRLGVEVPEGCTKADANDRLNIEYVSRWLDQGSWG